MNWQLLWFVLAGLVLGFALSTLWEWFYFRRERMSVSDERIDELEAQLRAYEERDRAQATAAPSWTAPAYQGTGVLLESEQVEEVGGKEKLAGRSAPLAPQATGENDADDSGFEAPESDVEQLDTTTVVVEEDFLVEDDIAIQTVVQTVVEEDDPSAPDTLNRTAVAGAAVVATAVTATVLGDAVLNDDASEDLESSDSSDADLEVTQNFVSPEADTDDEEPEVSASEEPLSDAVTAAGLATVAATVAATVGDRLGDSADEAIVEPADQESATQADDLDIVVIQDTKDDVVDGSEDDQSDGQPTMPRDDETAASVNESVTDAADEQTAAFDDGPIFPAIQDVAEESTVEQAAASISDEFGDDVDAPVDEAAEEFVDERYGMLAERSVVAEIDEQAEIVDVEPNEVPAGEQTDGPLNDEETSEFAPLRVDDLAPPAELAERSAEFPDELLGAALLASAVGDGEAANPEPDPTSNEPIIWKSEEIRGHPDNLSRIKGIGKVYRARLYDAGVFTWHQLGQMSEDEIREIVHPFVSADVEEWPKRARELAERNGRIGAQYVGPSPDDLMEIRGIGSYAMQRLYKSGIWSFQQLAAKSPEELEAILPVSPSGEAIDYQRWIIIATELSEERSG